MTDDVRHVESDETDSAEPLGATELPDADVQGVEPDDTEPDDTEPDDTEPDHAEPHETELDHAEPHETESAPPKRRRLRLPGIRVPRFLRNSKLVTAVLVALLVITGGVASWVYFKQYRPDQQTDAGVKKTVVDAASDGTVALLSYSADTLEHDFASAKSHLAGDFLSYYSQFTEQVVTPAAKGKQLKTSAHVTGAAVSALHPDSAAVLIFVDQKTTSKDNPQPTLAISTVVVNMTRINGKWMITKFTPVS